MRVFTYHELTTPEAQFDPGGQEIVHTEFVPPREIPEPVQSPQTV